MDSLVLRRLRAALVVAVIAAGLATAAGLAISQLASTASGQTVTTKT